MQPLIKYPGAKNKLSSWLLDYVPEHKVYLEPYFGSGGLFFSKKEAHIETINDIDGEVVNFFKVIREDGENLAKAIYMTPYSREEYYNAYDNNNVTSDLERARRFAIKCWLGFGNGNKYKNGFRTSVSYISPNPTLSFNSLPERILQVVDRLRSTQIENRSALDLIKRYDDKDIFIYCDPPYLKDIRKNNLYNYEMTNSEHEKLLDTIIISKSKIMISGYDSQMYNEKLKNWNRAERSIRVEKGIERQEVIWFNYEIDQQLKMF